MKQITQPAARIEEVCPQADVPEAIQRVIYKSLHKDPEARQQTMLLLKQELMAAASQHIPILERPIPVRNAAAPTPAETPTAQVAPESPVTALLKSSLQMKKSPVAQTGQIPAPAQQTDNNEHSRSNVQAQQTVQSQTERRAPEQKPQSPSTPTHTQPVAQQPRPHIAPQQSAAQLQAASPQATPPQNGAVRTNAAAIKPALASSADHPSTMSVRSQGIALPEFSLPREPSAAVIEKVHGLCARQNAIACVLLTEVLERRGSNQGKAELLVVVQLMSAVPATVRDLLSEKLERAVFTQYKEGAINILFTGDGPQLAKVRANARALFKRQ